MTICYQCGADLRGKMHHSGERGMTFCCGCAHPPMVCPAQFTSSPYNAEPAKALNNIGGLPGKKNNQPSGHEPSKDTQSTKTGGASGQALVPTLEAEKGKGVIPEGEVSQEKEGGIMPDEKPKRRRRWKGLLDWVPMEFRAGEWTITKLKPGEVNLCDGHGGIAGGLIIRFTSIEEAMDYAEGIEGHRRKWAVKAEPK